MYKVAVVTQFENDFDKYVTEFGKNRYEYLWIKDVPFPKDKFVKIIKALHYDRVKDVETVLYKCVQQLITPIGVVGDDAGKWMVDPNEVYLHVEDRHDAKGVCFKSVIFAEGFRHEYKVAYNLALRNVGNYEQFMVTRKDFSISSKKVTNATGHILKLKKMQQEEERKRMNEEREAYFRSRLGIKD